MTYIDNFRSLFLKNNLGKIQSSWGKRLIKRKLKKKRIGNISNNAVGQI